MPVQDCFTFLFTLQACSWCDLPAAQSMRAYAEWGRETEMKVQDSSGLARPDEQLSFLQLQVCPVMPSSFWRSTCVMRHMRKRIMSGLEHKSTQLSFSPTSHCFKHKSPLYLQMGCADLRCVRAQNAL